MGWEWQEFVADCRLCAPVALDRCHPTPGLSKRQHRDACTGENPVFHPTLEWDGQIWISDFKQRDFWSGPNYRIKSAEVLHRVDDMRFPRNITDEYAPIVMLQHQACVIIDHEGPYRLADDDFTEEYSRDIQQRLMIDYANRLVAAYGGKDKLRIELLNQYVDVTTLPEALRYALRTLRLTK